MKIKNFKSAIHNFAHSFQSIDYTKSQELAVNVLIYLKNQNKETIVEFDFLNKSITPSNAVTKNSQKLLEDYCDWLPEHLLNHNCDIALLEIFKIKLMTDFSKSFTPKGMNSEIQFTISTETTYKIKERNIQTIYINQDEIISKRFLKIGFPDF